MSIFGSFLQGGSGRFFTISFEGSARTPFHAYPSFRSLPARSPDSCSRFSPPARYASRRHGKAAWPRYERDFRGRTGLRSGKSLVTPNGETPYRHLRLPEETMLFPTMTGFPIGKSNSPRKHPLPGAFSFFERISCRTRTRRARKRRRSPKARRRRRR